MFSCTKNYANYTVIFLIFKKIIFHIYKPSKNGFNVVHLIDRLGTVILNISIFVAFYISMKIIV